MRSKPFADLSAFVGKKNKRNSSRYDEEDEDDDPKSKKKKKKKKKRSGTSLVSVKDLEEDLPKPVSHRGKVWGVATPDKKAGAALTKSKWAEAERRALHSIFGEKADDIAARIDAGDNDGAQVMIYKQLLKMLVGIIPVAEAVVHREKGTRGIYQLNQMLSGIRELLADMQAIQDRGTLGLSLVERYLRPAFFDIAKQMVVNNHRMLSEILAYVDNKDAESIREIVRTTQRGIGKYVEEQYADISENIIKGLT